MKICCVKTSRLPVEWIEKTASLPSDIFSYISNKDVCWIERSEAENDNTYKQIIPYVVVQNSAGRFLSYPRHGTERRLHGYYSCGIGGHIDQDDARDTFEKTVIAGMIRELSEELSDFRENKAELTYKGIINEKETPVGQVHLGLVYTACCIPDYTPQGAQELRGMEWKTLEELELIKKELWSDLALDLLSKTPRSHN
jgi:predicted NUDIX family phosphoesterase